MNEYLSIDCKVQKRTVNMFVLLPIVYRSIIMALAYALISSILWELFGVDFKSTLIFITPSLGAAAQLLSWVTSNCNPVMPEFCGYMIACTIIWNMLLCRISNNCDLW